MDLRRFISPHSTRQDRLHVIVDALDFLMANNFRILKAATRRLFVSGSLGDLCQVILMLTLAFIFFTLVTVTLLFSALILFQECSDILLSLLV